MSHQFPEMKPPTNFKWLLSPVSMEVVLWPQFSHQDQFIVGTGGALVAGETKPDLRILGLHSS